MGKHLLSVQLYSVRHEAERDLQGTLKRLKDMGYEGVDFYGAHGMAEEVKSALDNAGLFCAGWHVGYNQIDTDEALEKTVQYHQIIGNKYLVVPGLPSELTKTRDGWLSVAARLRNVAAILEPLGMYTGYHNHHVEFSPLGGEHPWDTLLENTGSRVIGQLDTGNAMHGNADPIALLKKYPGRAITIHLKPYSAANGFDTMIGQDDTDWLELLALCEAGGTEQYIVEYESEKLYEPLEGVRLCAEALRRLGY